MKSLAEIELFRIDNRIQEIESKKLLDNRDKLLLRHLKAKRDILIQHIEFIDENSCIEGA